VSARRFDIPVRFRVLGPLHAVIDGHALNVGPPKRRTLLGLLLLECGRCVPVDRLVDLAWDTPPPAARRVVFAHIARLRRMLAPAAAYGVVLDSTSPGYTLRADPAGIDVHLFRQLAGQAAAVTDPADRADLLRRALGLWRGRALEGLTGGSGLQRICHGLDSVRFITLEDRIEADLEAGRHRLVRAELTELFALHPLNERLAGQLMLALYRCGNTKEALEVYQRTRLHLATELGIDPGPELERLHMTILRQDDSLAAPLERAATR
jgi:DNA-binding SARP family transcriptional activator